MQEESKLKTRRSFTDLRQLAIGNLRIQDPVHDERVFRDEEYNEQDGLLNNDSSNEVINMSNFDGTWKESNKRSKSRKVIKVFCSKTLCATFSFILFMTGFFLLVVKLSASNLTSNNSHKNRHLYYNGSTFYDTTVIYISLDGFRNDYLNRHVTPNIDRIAQQGIKAEYMMPSFPSITFPNHWTLATGLYPESHGIVANEFYDPKLQEFFVHVDADISKKSVWWGGEPIWVTSSNQGKRAAVVMWPGSNAESNSLNKDYIVPYQSKYTAKDKMDLLLNWLDLPLVERPQLMSVYIPQIDQTGHNSGPEGEQMNAIVKDMDDALGHLLIGLSQRNLENHVHIVLVSDHGMADSDKSKYIYYTDFISKESQSYLCEREAWPLLGLRVKDDAPEHALDQIYNEIVEYTKRVENPHFQVFKRQDMPDRFHYNATDRIAPLVLLPDVGYVIVNSTDSPPKGIHGYDNLAPEMRALFVAKGPHIQKHYKPGSIVEPFFNVEVYRFLTRLLGLKPAPSNATLDGVFTISKKNN